ncbi:hypothetical protein PAMA_016781 [Pampus argenteus]
MSLTAAASGFVVFLLSVSVVQGQNDYGVTYTSTQICAFKGSTVDINCSYRYPSRVNDRDATVNETLWFNKGSDDEPVDLRTESEYAGRVQYHCDKNDCTLRITDLRESDSAEYKFMFIMNQPGGKFTGSPGVRLTVTDLQVEVIRSIVYQDYTKAELKCHSSCRLPDRSSYIWYKNGQKIETETSSYSFYFYPEDSHSCAVEGREDFASLPVCVRGESCSRVIYTDRSICASRGSSVDISCSYSSYEYITSSIWFSSDRRHQWQNPSQPEDLSEDSQYAGRVEVRKRGGRSTLRISDLRESDSAQYHFTFRTDFFKWRSSLPGTTLTVTDLQVEVIRSTVYQYSTKAELKCHSSCRLPDRSSYIWYKNGQKFKTETSSSYSAFFYPPDSHSCAVKGHEDFASLPVCVRGEPCRRVIYTDRSICAFRGSSVDISCSYSSYESIRSSFWFSSDRRHQEQNPSQPEDLSEDSQYAGRVEVLETERGRSTLRISDLRESDSAQYHFTFRTDFFQWRSSLPGTTLTVTDLQVKVIRSTVSQYYTRAELKCHSSCRLPDRSSYIWYRNGQKMETESSSSYSSSFFQADSHSCAVKGHEDFASLPVCVHGESCRRVIYTDRSICAFRGSSVDISCSYSSYGSIRSSFWFSSDRRHQEQNPSQPEDLSEDSQYAGRVEVLETERGRSTLRISDLRESDSAQYHFTFRTYYFEWRSSLPGTTLTVTGTDEHGSLIPVTTSPVL